MKILFCNIAWMKKYRGVTDHDIPVNGGSYVDEQEMLMKHITLIQ